MIEPALADDMLEGTRAIAEFIYGDGASPRKVQRAIDAGRIPVFRIGKRICARRSVIIEAIKQQERASIARMRR